MALETRQTRFADREKEREARAYQPLSPTGAEEQAAADEPPNAGPAYKEPGTGNIAQSGHQSGGSKYNPSPEETKLMQLRQKLFMMQGPTGMRAFDEKLKGAHPMDHIPMLEAELKGGAMAGQLPGQTLSGLPNPFLSRGTFSI